MSLKFHRLTSKFETFISVPNCSNYNAVSLVKIRPTFQDIALAIRDARMDACVDGGTHMDARAHEYVGLMEIILLATLYMTLESLLSCISSFFRHLKYQ